MQPSRVPDAPSPYHVDPPHARRRDPAPRRRTASAVRSAVLLLIVPTVLAPADLALAQQEELAGAVAGRVVAESGEPVVGATIRLLADTVVVASGVTDAAGTFRIVRVPPGVYDVRADHIGYRGAGIDGFRVRPDRRESVRIVLETAPIELQGIHVAARDVSIRIDDADLRTEVTAAQLNNLPVPKIMSQVVDLTPGARPDHVWGGSTAQANNYRIDGVAANHPGVGGTFLEPSLRWLERIEVAGLGAGARHGGFQGGLIDAVTKSGSNQATGAIRTSGQGYPFAESNLGPFEIGSETTHRFDLQAELGGPIVRDRLFYFVAGEMIDEDSRHIAHVEEVADRYSPLVEGRDERKVFGKLTWNPSQSDVVNLSSIFVREDVGNYGMMGYEADNAAHRLDAQADVVNLEWQHNWGATALFEVKGSYQGGGERQLPYEGPEVPGVKIFGYEAPYARYQNAPLRYRRDAENLTGSAALRFDLSTGPLQHQLEIGGEHSVGTWINQRKRNGGVTWRPVHTRSFDPGDPGTWVFGVRSLLPSTWGGEVDLDAEAENSAVYIQDDVEIVPGVRLSAGLRWGRWTGRLTPAGGGTPFTAVRDDAFDPRIGLVWDVTGDADFVAKAHWGRYHQYMFARFFDRVEGGDVYTNEELWYHWGADFDDPHTTYTVAQRDSLAALGRFELRERVQINQQGPVEEYRQPYIDQLVLSLEKTVADAVKFKAVYVNRRNRDMVALVDRNATTNYTAFDRVRVMEGGTYVEYNGFALVLPRIYLRNDRLIEILKHRALYPEDYPPIPGLTAADTLRLTWDPDYVLMNPPAATRRFDQLQLVAEVVQPTWGLTASLVFTDLRGNFDSVTGYEERSPYEDDLNRYSPGPFVRPNERTDSFGPLENFADWAWKLAGYTQLPLDLRGGAYWRWQAGDHYTPVYVVTPNVNSYQLLDGRGMPGSFATNVAGERINVDPRGSWTYPRYGTLDLRLERIFDVPGGTMLVTLDALNVFHDSSITDWNTVVNRGKDFFGHLKGLDRNDDPNSYYRAVWKRIRPFTLRLGTEFRF